MFVAGGRPPVALDLINGTGVDICRLSMTPAAAIYWGRDILDTSTIPPDGSFDYTAAAGVYDIRATDCSGGEIAVQSGVDFQTDAQFVIANS